MFLLRLWSIVSRRERPKAHCLLGFVIRVVARSGRASSLGGRDLYSVYQRGAFSGITLLVGSRVVGDMTGEASECMIVMEMYSFPGYIVRLPLNKIFFVASFILPHNCFTRGAPRNPYYMCVYCVAGVLLVYKPKVCYTFRPSYSVTGFCHFTIRQV